MSVNALLSAVLVYLAASNVLLWSFLGVAAPLTVAVAAAAIGLIVGGLKRGSTASSRVAVRDLAACIAVASVLLIIAGEGRLFYANIDWQVRSALLGDMGRTAWPFVYRHENQDLILRAPLGMYFVPALAWHALGERAAQIALLLQNAALVGALLAASAPLFASGRARLVALAVFVGFSGMDVLGALSVHGFVSDHLEFWAPLQYSSTITMLFWVPQHAIAGWAGAVCYLLWRQGLAPARLLLTITPLTALWSPLALIGLMPLAAHAGLALLSRRQVRPLDIAVPALAVALVLPTLAYLGADPESVGYHLIACPPIEWFLFQAFETLPFLIPLWFAASAAKRIDPGLVIVTAVLLVLPFLQIGYSIDLMMRGSIPALAALAVMVAQEIDNPDGGWRIWLLGVLALGSATGFHEIARAFRHPAAPEVSCTMFEAWDAGWQSGQSANFPKATYIARLEALPALLRPSAPARVPAYPGRTCWPGEWYRPTPL